MWSIQSLRANKIEWLWVRVRCAYSDLILFSPCKDLFSGSSDRIWIRCYSVLKASKLVLKNKNMWNVLELPVRKPWSNKCWASSYSIVFSPCTGTQLTLDSLPEVCWHRIRQYLNNILLSLSEELFGYISISWAFIRLSFPTVTYWVIWFIFLLGSKSGSILLTATKCALQFPTWREISDELHRPGKLLSWIPCLP